MTTEMIYEKCRKFKAGDKIYINRSVRGGNGEPATIVKIAAVIIARYQNYLLTERESGIKECFTYAEIVMENVITKRVGRPRKG